MIVIFEHYESILKTIKDTHRKLKKAKDGAEIEQLNAILIAANDESAALLKEMEKAIDNMQDRTIKCVMRMRYLCGMTVKDIASETYYHPSNIYRFLKKAKEETERPP